MYTELDNRITDFLKENSDKFTREEWKEEFPVGGKEDND
jgi:hypothetical protein